MIPIQKRISSCLTAFFLSTLFVPLSVAETASHSKLPVSNGLFLDLNANVSVDLEDQNRVRAWHNQVAGNTADIFVKRDEGREVAGSGRPTLKTKVAEIGGNSTLIFEEQELVNMEEDAFDHMATGSGYTWFSIMSVYKQNLGKPNVNSFFGNLRNGNPYDGFWANLMDDNRVWIGYRNGLKTKKKTKGLWDEQQNPLVVSPQPLTEKTYYLIIGRMGSGQGVVDIELFINSTTPVDRKKVPVNPEANPSKMAIGQERDATNHPGFESFSGEITRFLLFDRPLNDQELSQVSLYLIKQYHIQSIPK